jgi:Homing endonuclease associated repeat
MISKFEIIAELKRVAEMLGTNKLSQKDYEELGTINRGIIYNRFGNWKDAIAAASLTPGRMGADISLSDDELLLEIIKVTSELDKIPSDREMNAYGSFSVKPYRQRWGKFTTARDVAYEKYGNPIALNSIKRNSRFVMSSLPDLQAQNLEESLENESFKKEDKRIDSKQISVPVNQGLILDLKSNMIESAKEASGQDDKFCSIVDKLPLDKSFPIDLAKELERELRQLLNCNDRNATLGLLLRQAKDNNSLTEMGIDLAHTIRKQRNFLAHEEIIDQKALHAQIFLCLFAAALLWPELSP